LAPHRFEGNDIVGLEDSVQMIAKERLIDMQTQVAHRNLTVRNDVVVGEDRCAGDPTLGKPTGEARPSEGHFRGPLQVPSEHAFKRSRVVLSVGAS
jgi:hypothetical protein